MKLYFLFIKRKKCNLFGFRIQMGDLSITQDKQKYHVYQRILSKKTSLHVHIMQAVPHTVCTGDFSIQDQQESESTVFALVKEME